MAFLDVGVLAALMSEVAALRARVAALERERKSLKSDVERAVRSFADRLEDNDAIEAIHWAYQHGDAAIVWTVIPRMDLDLQDLIYAAEAETAREHRALLLDFRTIFRGERALSDVVLPPGATAFRRT